MNSSGPGLYRRVTNRESARRVRHKRQETMSELKVRMSTVRSCRFQPLSSIHSPSPPLTPPPSSCPCMYVCNQIIFTQLREYLEFPEVFGTLQVEETNQAMEERLEQAQLEKETLTKQLCRLQQECITATSHNQRLLEDLERKSVIADVSCCPPTHPGSTYNYQS